MNITPTMLALLILGISTVAPAANADVVDLKWTGGVFFHKAGIAPKTFLEVCGKLKMGDGVRWQFKANAPSDFNIRYYIGKEVSYPENRKEVASADGMFYVPVDQDYCWMWSNRSVQLINVEVELKQAN